MLRWSQNSGIGLHLSEIAVFSPSQTNQRGEGTRSRLNIAYLSTFSVLSLTLTIKSELHLEKLNLTLDH